MTTIEKAAVDAAVSRAFRGGERRERQLRLSAAEVEYLDRYAVLTPMPGGESGEKRWYCVRLKGEREK